MKAISVKRTCNNCGEEVEIVITKKQIKAILKGFKASNKSQAEITVEKILGIDEKGVLKG